MKHIFRSFAFSILAAWAPLHAADNITSRWSDLCHVAGGHQLKVATTDGRTIDGSCTSTDADTLSLSSNQRIVKIARSTLTRIQMYEPGSGHHLADLGNGMSKSFHRGFGWLFSPAAPLGLVTIPATIAWGAVSAPFCILGDIGQDGPSTHEITLTD